MKTGLVLEGGALRTIYSSGVTDAFLEEGLSFDYCIGVSGGIAYGISYLSGQFGRNLELLTKYAPTQKYMGITNMLSAKNRHCYFGLKFTYVDIPTRLVPFDNAAFARWPGIAEAVMTDLTTGEALYKALDPQDKNLELLQATCAMPLLFPIYEIDGRPCLDGGASDSIPWKHALAQGCDRVVVVLTKPRSYRRKDEPIQKLIEWRYRKYPKFLEAMRTRADRYNRDRDELFEAERQGRAFVFAPETTLGVSRIERDPDKLRALWELGRKEGHDRAAALKEYLK